MIRPPAAATKTATTARVTTGSIAAGAFANVTVTLPTAQATTSYTATTTVEDSNGDLTIRGIVSRTTTQVVVRVQNTSALNARTGTIHLLTWSD